MKAAGKRSFFLASSAEKPAETAQASNSQALPSPKTVLIADDAAVNRKMLMKLLSPEYSLLEADNGESALKLLKQYGTSIDAVLLDLVMPVLNGFDVLRAMQAESAYQNIPIIVATGSGDDKSEADALKLGAWDFITKPYNGEIIKFRLHNAIQRSQLSAYNQLKYLAEFDVLTGIYNKAKFFSATREMLDDHSDLQFAFIRMDIDRFQLINSFFGSDEGDQLLCYLADGLKHRYSNGAYKYGRIEADVFGACFAYPTQQQVLDTLDDVKEWVKSYNRDFDIVPIFGVYFVDDPTLPVNEMLDRATMAAKTCKGSYLNTIAVYQPEMSRKLEKEQEIINEMAAALEQQQYHVFLQPKYSLMTESPTGAEALVRWFHPVKVVISPGEFIPIFEKNGFISKVDYYVWQTVCKLLQRWIADGIQPLPISVNVSRANLYNPNFVNLITELVKQYEVPPRLLELELTESAYMDNPQMMEQVVEQLHQAGFVILMDDFGSGYSSLSLLKDVEVDVVKIDMRFFEKARGSGRGENIIASIVRMAKWLNIPVTAEGVETQEQADFLRGVGCDNIQGYYYAKPMPIDDYVQLMQAEEKKLEPVRESQVSLLNVDRLWGLDPEMQLLFAEDPSPKAVFEYGDDELELLRVNKSFKNTFGYGNTAADATPLNFVAPEYHSVVLDACLACVDQHAIAQCEYLRDTADGRTLWVRLTLQYVQKMGGKHILIGYLQDITELKTLRGLTHDSEGSFSNVIAVPRMRELLAYLTQIFDVARLVDPEQTTIIRLTESGEIENEPYACFQVWKRCERCENCSSRCAMKDNMRMTKYEYIKNDIFYVVSNPITVVDSLQRRHRFVLEVVSHVSDHLLLAQPGEKSIREVIEETQKKIYTDVLTGAYNRRYLSELLFVRQRQSSVATQLGLVLLDLNRFKQINDEFGHEEGDRILTLTAEQLKSAVRQNDTVVRYGGDEFVVTLIDCTEEQVRQAIARMRRALSEIHYGNKQEQSIMADFGYAYTPRLELTYGAIEKLLRAADAAMYEEKKRESTAADSE